MKVNMGKLDQSLRLLIALVLLGCSVFQVFTGVWILLGYVIAGILGLTAGIKFCPLYALLGIHTQVKS